MLDRASEIPLYTQLAEAIREDILSGRVRPGDRLPSEARMMEAYGVGRLTVRNALAGLTREGLVEKAQGKGTFCRTAGDRRTADIEVILDMRNTYFIPYYVKGISEVLRANACSYLINDTNTESEELCSRLESVLERNISGVIFQITRTALPDEVRERMCGVLEKLHRKGIPCIMIDSIIQGANVSYAVIDEKAGGSRAAEHLAAYRHRRCAIVYRREYLDSAARRESFLQAARRFGMEKVTEIDCDRDPDPALLDAVGNRGVTGIFGYNDEVALRCMRTLQAAGYDVPGQVSVIGYDDSYLAETAGPPLTTIFHPKEIMGRHVAHALLRLLRGEEEWPHREVFQPHLVCRGSCDLCRDYR